MTREEAIKKLLEEHCGYGDGDCDRCKFKCEIYMAIEALRQVEELEAEIDVLNWTIEKLSKERPEGRWISNGIPESTLRGCSACGYTCGAYTFNYCPNCGAEMRGEEE